MISGATFWRCFHSIRARFRERNLQVCYLGDLWSGLNRFHAFSASWLAGFVMDAQHVVRIRLRGFRSRDTR
jgi:hypothetical protein